MRDLIARLEQATGPDPALDLAIAIAVWGRPGVLVARQDQETGVVSEHTHWRYTCSVDAALSLVPEGRGWLIARGALTETEPPYAAQVLHFRDPTLVFGEGEAVSAPLALCIASIKARRA